MRGALSLWARGRGGSPTGPADQLLIVAGQSNAVTQAVSGSGSLPAGWADTARVQMWNNSANVFATYSPGAATNWGPEVAYAKAWLDANADNDTVLYIVKLAIGGSQLGAISIYGQLSSSNQDWSQVSTGHWFDQMTAEVTPAKAALSSPYSIRVFWIGNQSDGQSQAATDDLAANLATHFAAIRSEWAAADTPITFVTIPDNVLYRTAEVVAKERQALVADGRSKLVEMRFVPFQGDGIHMAAGGVNQAGAAAYALQSGPLAPTGFSFSGGLVQEDASPGTVVATFKPAYMDGSQEAVFSIVGGSDDFEFVGFELRVKTGATLSAGVVAVPVRVAGAGGFFEDDADITVTAAGQWWANNDFLAVDWDNDRAYINGTSYASIAAAIAAGAIVDTGTIKYSTVTLPAAFSIFEHVVNSSTTPSAVNPHYGIGIDDGDDATPADELIFIARTSTPRVQLGVITGSAAQLGTTDLVGGVNNSAEARHAARIQVNNMNHASNGIVGTTDTACTVPVASRVVYGNRTDGARTWLGTLKYTRISSEIWDNAMLTTLTTPP